MNDKMKCKCACCELGNCDCINECEATGLVNAWTDGPGEYWWGSIADKPEHLTIKCKICENCRVIK